MDGINEPDSPNPGGALTMQAVMYLELRNAVRDLLNDIRRRYPGEDLRCQYMRRLDELSK